MELDRVRAEFYYRNRDGIIRKMSASGPRVKGIDMKACGQNLIRECLLANIDALVDSSIVRAEVPGVDYIFIPKDKDETVPDVLRGEAVALLREYANGDADDFDECGDGTTEYFVNSNWAGRVKAFINRINQQEAQNDKR